MANDRPSFLPLALVLAGIYLIAGNLRAAITSVGPVLSSIEESLGLSAFAAAFLVSLPLLAFAVVSPAAPSLAARIGIEASIAVSLALLIVGMLLRSTPGLQWLWVGTALIGSAIAVLNVVLPALVKREFPTRIGQVTGVYSAVQSSFAAVAAGISAPVAGLTALGWRLPLSMWAGLALIALVVFAPQLRRRTLPSARDADITLDSAQIEASGHRSPWRSPLAWMITAYMGLQSFMYFSFTTWLASIEADAGNPPGSIHIHQFLINALGILGNLLCVALIPRMRDQRILTVIGPAAFAVGTLGLLFAPRAAIVWVCFLGAAAGMCIVLSLSFFGLRTVNHAQAASLSGMAQCLGYLIASAGPIGFGLLHDVTGSWAPSLIACLVLDGVLVLLGLAVGRNRSIDRH